MNGKKTFVLTYNLVKGEPIKIKVDVTEEEIYNVGSAIENAMRGNYLGIELNKKLHLIPMHNIQSVEIDPSPQRIIANVIRDAQPAD